MAGRIVSALFVIYLGCNMLLCAVLFAPWALPRETISGLMGRWASTESGRRRKIGKAAAMVIDIIHHWEPDHCRLTYRLEKAAREKLYP